MGYFSLRAVAGKAIKLLRLLRVSGYRRALWKGVAGGVEHEQVLRGDRYRTIIDIGANRGQFALAARRVCPDARIVSFEPLVDVGDIFRAVFAGDDLTTLFAAAVGPQKRKTRIHVSQRDDSSSLLPISALQEQVFPGTGEAGTRWVDEGPLDNFLASDSFLRPTMLKLDVQGFELEALKGCASLLGVFDTIYVECSFVELYCGQALLDEVVAWLYERGFRLRGAYNLYYDAKGLAVQGDFLFERV